jgi:hypothetical protein
MYLDIFIKKVLLFVTVISKNQKNRSTRNVFKQNKRNNLLLAKTYFYSQINDE